MKTLKKIFKNISANYVTFFKNYIVTNILIFISTILTIIFLNEDIALELFKYEIFFVANSFTVENFFKNKKSRIVGFVFAYIASFILGYLFNNYESEFENFFIFYVISILSINLFNLIKETKLELNDYLHQIFSNLLSTTIINIVLNIGIFAVLGIITSLLIPDIDFDIFLRTEIAILGFYTIPAYLYAFINKDSKITDLANILLKYVIVPLTYIALIVVYLYIFKILFTRNMPSNSVFGIILALFIECMPIFALYKSLKIKSKFLELIAKNITFVFIPLYLLQAYAMIIRVATYGLTKDRYLGLTILFVEAVILFLMKFKERKYLIYTLYIFALVTFVAILVPGINYEDTSIKYQSNVIEKILKDKKILELNGEELAKVSSAYKYLKNENALDKLKIKIDKNDEKILEPYYAEYDYFYESFDANENVVDISKYSKMEFIDSVDKESAGSKAKIKNYEIDLSETFEKMISKEKIEELIYKLDENNDFYVKHLDINGESGKVKYYTIEGYILTK